MFRAETWLNNDQEVWSESRVNLEDSYIGFEEENKKRYCSRPASETADTHQPSKSGRNGTEGSSIPPPATTTENQATKRGALRWCPLSREEDTKKTMKRIPAAVAAAAILSLNVRGMIAAASLDLYIRDRYGAADGETLCRFCAESGGCSLDSRELYVQGACRSRGAGRASVYGRLADNPGVVCRQDFPETGCTEQPAFGVGSLDECGQTWVIDACEDSIRMTALEGWCILSESPSDPYVVPLVLVKEWAGPGACEGDDYQSRLVTSDENLCIVENKTGAATVSGSRRRYCVGDTLRVEQFTDRQCSVADVLDNSLDGTSDTCQPNGTTTVECLSPQIFCRNLYSTDFGLELNGPGSTQPTDDPSEVSSDAPTPPTKNASDSPSTSRSSSPSEQPSSQPSDTPSVVPTARLSSDPTNEPTDLPTRQPSFSPSTIPQDTQTDPPMNSSSQPGNEESGCCCCKIPLVWFTLSCFLVWFSM